MWFFFFEKFFFIRVDDNLRTRKPGSSRPQIIYVNIITNILWVLEKPSGRRVYRIFTFFIICIT